MTRKRRLMLFRTMTTHDIETALVYFLFDLDVAEAAVTLLKERIAVAKQVLKERG